MGAIFLRRIKHLDKYQRSYFFENTTILSISLTNIVTMSSNQFIKHILAIEEKIDDSLTKN